MISLCADFARLGYLKLDAEGGGALTGEAFGSLGGEQRVGLFAAAVDGEVRGGFGETVELHELPAEVGFQLLYDAGGRGRAGYGHADSAGDRVGEIGGGVQHGFGDGGRAAEVGDSVLGDAPQDFGAVNLAQHHLRCACSEESEGHSPAVAVEHGEGVEIHIVIAHAGRPAESDGVEPDVAMGHLHAFGSSGGAGGVVDGGGGVFVGLPRAGIGIGGEQGLVAFGAEGEAMGAAVAGRDAGEGASQAVSQFRVYEKHGRAGVLHDVADFLLLEAEVDGHADAARAAAGVDGQQKTGGVVRDDGDALALAHAEAV